MKAITRTIKLDDPQIKIFKESKKNNVTEFNYKTINHFREGNRIFVYPRGTYGGGQIGLIPKRDEKYIIGDPETASYELEGKDIYLEVVVNRVPERTEVSISIPKWLIYLVLGLIILSSLKTCI